MKTKYINLASSGGLRLTVSEAEALVRIINQCLPDFDAKSGAEITAIKRACIKLETAIEFAPLDEENK